MDWYLQPLLAIPYWLTTATGALFSQASNSVYPRPAWNEWSERREDLVKMLRLHVRWQATNRDAVHVETLVTPRKTFTKGPMARAIQSVYRALLNFNKV